MLEMESNQYEEYMYKCFKILRLNRDHKHNLLLYHFILQINIMAEAVFNFV